jgi:hypothetical protein
MDALDAVFARADAIADAVLWEGYVLYPYRRSAAKNRMRFQWGVVGPAEEPTMTAAVLVDTAAATVHVRVRFLHLHRRDDGWDEAVAVHRDVEVAVQAGSTSFPISVDGGGGGDPIAGRLDVQCVLDGELARLSVTVVNHAERDPSAPRNDALLRSMVGCHVLFAAATDVFASLLEPADDVVAVAASQCVQHRCWPVLVGPAPRRDLVLASPVILYDFPAVSPESVGDFFDGTEIDEMLTLRVQTMTDAEKAEARATDPRAAAIINRCDTITDGEMASLHGVVHGAGDAVDPLDPSPEWSDPGPAAVRVGDALVARGSRVVLHPRRRADAHDIFLRDRVATVAEIVNDVDGAVHLAVTIDDDPGADLWEWQRRYLYFAPDEVEVLAEGAGRG